MSTEPDDEEEFTELVDARIPRVDLVGKAANGHRFLIAKATDGGQRGLFEPEFVRELIAKADANDTETGTVTMSGSPAAIAALIHGAAVRKATPPAVPVDAEYVQLVKAKYNADDLKRMAGNGHAMPDESYPIEDEDDLGKAIKAVGRGGSSHDAIRRHIIARAKALGASSQIPDNWKADGSLKEGSVSKTEAATVAKFDMSDPEMLDPTEVLAEPQMEMPGDENDPGSPAWEAVDAATACKWMAILSRAKNALEVLSEREALESVSSDGEPYDAENSWNLDDAACAIDYVISVLAPYAVDEHAEATMAAEQLEAVGKALAEAVAPLDVIEGLVPLKKAGRSLSSSNENAIRDAIDALQRVLSSLPAPADAEAQAAPVAKSDTTTTEVAVSTQGTAISVEDLVRAFTGAAATVVAKAKGDPMVAVYDANGNLVGTVAQADITLIADAAPAAKDGDGGDGGDATDGADANTQTSAAAPAAVIPGTNTVAAPVPPADGDGDQVQKAAKAGDTTALTETLAAIAKQLEQHAGLADVVKGLQEQVAHLAAMPDDRKSPLLNGATGTAGIAGRGAAQADEYAELRKAVETAATPAEKRDAQQQLAYAQVKGRFTR